MNRREFILCASATALTVQRMFGAEPRYKIGYTTNTTNPDPALTWAGDSLRGFREAHEVGFNYVEAFASALLEFYPDDADGLKKRINEIGVKFAAITGGANAAAKGRSRGPGGRGRGGAGGRGAEPAVFRPSNPDGPGGNTHFEDPASRQAVIENHLAVVRFAKKFGCDHQKTNLDSPRRPEGTTQEDLKNIVETLSILCRRSLEEEGIPFGVHAHLGNQLQTESEINYIMENTDPKYVKFVLDTGHITMAGMDPIALAKKLGHRVVEFHLKDVNPEDRGGAKVAPTPSEPRSDYFFPLGHGGVDFMALKAHLDHIQWKGFLVVELDATTPLRSPKECARITADYIKNKMKIPL